MGKKILLADDSITIQKVIELTFSDEDFEVITVGNGRLALEKLPEVRPDIVLCDIIMPEKDGYEVCDQIKKNPAFSHVPVLLLTGAFEPFDQERAVRAGYDGSLAKPFEPETLIAKVRDLLARAPQRPAAAPPLVVPFQRPAAQVPPPAFVAPLPPPPPLPPASAGTPVFISDEPFDTQAAEPAPEPAPAPPPPAALAPMSEEESATLLAAPDAHAPGPPEPESTSTVMFSATDLPWNLAAVPVPHTPAPAPAPPPPPPPAPAPPAPAAFAREPEVEFEPASLDTAEVVEDAGVFEEVVEEDLEFDSSRPAGFDDAEAADSGATLMFTASKTMPPMVPRPADTSATTASFAPREEQTFEGPELDPSPEPEPVRPTPPPAFVQEPAPPPPPAFVHEPPPAPAAPAAMPTQPSMPAVRSVAPPPLPVPPPPPAPPAPLRFEPSPVQSFADVASSVEETTMPPPASEAAAVSVPVEMVEKIAQRVVAQISEKVVREIAWEIIPDLAEALIKQEIERLKAELQKL